MASLTGSTISSSYERLLTLPEDGGNGTSYVNVTDGDGETTFGIRLSTEGASFSTANDATHPERIIHIGYDTYSGILIQAADGSWARGYNFGKYSDGSKLGQFGGYGSDDALSYMFIGEAYNDATIVFTQANNRVGIGTTSPSTTLHVAGSFAASGPSAAAIAMDSSATPSVAGGNIFTNTNAGTITSFDDGVIGQVIYVYSGAAVVYDDGAGNLKCGNGDITTANGDVTTWVKFANDWHLVSWKDQSATLNSGGF